jgi:eukaryotic-like serine/threonine-protein kinase
LINPERWKKIDELLDVVLELAPEKRAEFLQQACAGDEALKTAVEKLIAFDERENFLDSPALQAASKFLGETSPPRLSPGESIGPYKIVSLLGSGGMGEVYRAKDQRLEREVAIKVLPEGVTNNLESLARFDRETKALAALSHPNILAIYDVGNQDGNVYAVTELLKGETLRSHLARTKLTWEEAIAVGSCVAEGLAAAHSQGVIHRDLKPENIFLTSDGGVKILDFSLVRREKAEPDRELTTPGTQDELTRTGILMGTVPYMSPEQLRKLPMDARSDLFSFGTVLYEMISGIRPFSGNNAADLTASILKEDPAPLTIECPPLLVQTISRCLKKDPNERFQSAKDVALELKTAASGSVLPTVLATQENHWKKLFWIPFVIAAIAFLIWYSPWKNKSIHSIAVMPFLNSSKDPNNEYLSDGITESIIDSLSQVPDVRVMARGIVFTYKGKEIDPRKVGRELNVDAIVTGRIQQKDDNLVISTDLVDVSDGTQLWGKQYNRSATDLLLVQSEISRALSDRLHVSLTGQQQETVSKHYTENPEAYQFYLRGRYHWLKGTPEDYEKAREYFEKAVEKDPSFAKAYVLLASYYATLGTHGVIPPEEAWSKSNAALNRAKELDAPLVEANLGDAEYQIFHEWNWSRGEKAMKRGIELSPEDPDVHQPYSVFLRIMGRWEEAIMEAKRAQELDPLTISTNYTVATAYFWARQYDQALDQLKKTEELDPNYAEIHDALADVYERKGMYPESISEREKTLRLSGDEGGANALVQNYHKSGYESAIKSLWEKQLDALTQSAKQGYVCPMFFVFTYAHLNRKDEAFEWLEKAYQERSIWLVTMKTDPQFDSLRSDPRLNTMMKRIGLPL